MNEKLPRRQREAAPQHERKHLQQEQQQRREQKHEHVPDRALFEIHAYNHAGVLSHLIGLFARRACNLESIVCLPTGDGRTSRLWITIEQTERAARMVKFVARLEDVISVRIGCADALSAPVRSAMRAAAAGLAGRS
jgi:acetolactate synthase-1/3 small subunit